MSDLSLDTTVLSHFARANRMADLRAFTSSDSLHVPVIVLEELARGVTEYPALGTIPASIPIISEAVDSGPELVEFARYKGMLGGGKLKNNGEAAVIAWARVNGGIAVIDDAVGRTIARADGIPAHGSLWLIVRSYGRRETERAEAEHLVDDLIGTGMRLPLQTGAQLFAWAYEQGYLP